MSNCGFAFGCQLLLGSHASLVAEGLRNMRGLAKTFSVAALSWLEKVVTVRTDWMCWYKYDAKVVYIILIHAI